jgi:transposase
MKAYSLDLRERVVSAYEDGAETIREVAGQFLVSESFIKKMLARHRATGDVRPRGHGGGQKKRLSEAHRKWLLKTVLAAPDITLSELQQAILATKQAVVSVPTLSRELRALNLRRKKNQWLLAKETGEKGRGIGEE